MLLEALRQHPCAQPLLSPFVQFIKDKIYQSIDNVRKLIALLRFVDTLLRNPNLDFSEQVSSGTEKTSETQLQKLIFPLLSCLLSRTLDNTNELTKKISWDVRQRAGELFKRLRLNHKPQFKLIIPKLYQTLKGVIMKPSHSLASLYGLFLCVETLGPEPSAKLIERNLEVIGSRIHATKDNDEGIMKVLAAMVETLTKAASGYFKKYQLNPSRTCSQAELIERSKCPLLVNSILMSPNGQMILYLLGHVTSK